MEGCLHKIIHLAILVSSGFFLSAYQCMGWQRRASGGRFDSNSGHAGWLYNVKAGVMVFKGASTALCSVHELKDTYRNTRVSDATTRIPRVQWNAALS
jgi:hypothetical protein